MGPGFVIDSRLRQTSGDRVAMPQGRAQVGGADAEELLARIEGGYRAMLLSSGLAAVTVTTASGSSTGSGRSRIAS